MNLNTKFYCRTDETVAFNENAKWIWAENSMKDDWWIFKKSFRCPFEIHKATLLVTAATIHETYINGELIVRGPGRSFDFSKIYDVVDITQYVKTDEENVIVLLSPDLSEHKGILAEVIFESQACEKESFTTDESWLVEKHLSYQAGGPSNAPLPGCEEVYDARLEIEGWKNKTYEDCLWKNALELGFVGMFPFRNMEKSPIKLLSNKELLPKTVSAIELASPRQGYSFRLASTKSGIKAFITEVKCEEDATICLWFRSFLPLITLNGLLVESEKEVALKKGTNLLCCSMNSVFAGELELLVECSQNLSFYANGLLQGVQSEWAVLQNPSEEVAYPWHDPASGISGSLPDLEILAPELLQLSKTQQVEQLPESLLKRLEAAERKQPSVTLQIEKQKRIPLSDSKPFINENAMLHREGSSTVLKQEGKDVHFVLDFGTETIGYIQLLLNAPEGTIVDVHCFELIDGRGIYFMTSHNTVRYLCKEGLQTFTASGRRGFRYISVTLRNFHRPIELYKISCFHSSYPVERIGRFTCSDTKLQDIFKMSQETAALCMLDTYVDCPGHEQNFWVGDARITALINLIQFGGYTFNQRSIRLVGQSLSPEWVQTYQPTDERYTSGSNLPMAAFPNYPEGSLPMWTFLWILQCYDHYLYGGSREDLEENYRYVEDTLARCKRLTNERNLLDIPGAWNLIEWGNNDLSVYGEVTANSVFLVASYRCAQQMSLALGKHENAEQNRQEAEKVMEAINRYCWDGQKNAYVDTVRDEWAYQKYLDFCAIKNWKPDSWETYVSCSRISEQSNTLAYLYDCVPKNRQSYAEKLINRLEQGKYVFGSPAGRSKGSPSEQEAPGGVVAIGSPFFLFFSLGALFKNGNPTLALKVMERDWGLMLEEGTTTCWETFKMSETHWTRSVCHAWSAAPAVYLPTYVLGVRPIEAGFTKFVIEPFTGTLQWAKGTVATPYGPISVCWEKLDTGEVVIEWSGPKECERVFI